MKDICRQYRESYGESDLQAEIQQHANQCAECKEFARKQAALEGALLSWQAPDASSDFALNVMSRIAESQQAPQTVGEWFKHLFHMQLVVPMPAVAIAALLLVVSLPMNVFFLSTPTGVDGISGQQIVEATSNSRINVSNNIQPTIPAGQVIQVNQMEQYAPGLSLPPNLYGAGAFLLIPIVDPLTMAPDLTETQPNEVSDI